MDIESDVKYYCRQYPVTFDKASEHILETECGKKYIDFLAGAGSLNYGHNNKFIIKAVIDYLTSSKIINSLDLATTAKHTFMTTFNNTILKPRGLNYKLQFTGPTGTNAVEAALKLARKYTKRSNVIAFTNGFHGMTLGALAATGNVTKRLGAGTPLNNVTHMPFDGYYGQDINTLNQIEKLLNDPSSGIDKPAAFIVEVIQGEGGLNVASNQWLKQLQGLASTHGSLLIIDDIQAGCGRSGRFFSFEDAGMKPDMVCLSKSIGGCGLPLALTLIKPHLDIWKPGEQNGTFRGNNLAFVAGTAALKFWENPSFEEEIQKKSKIIRAYLDKSIRDLPASEAKTLGKGMFLGIEFRDHSIAARIMKSAFEKGLIIETCGSYDQVIKLMPPLTIESQGLISGMKIFTEALRESVGHLLKVSA